MIRRGESAAQASARRGCRNAAPAGGDARQDRIFGGE